MFINFMFLWLSLFAALCSFFVFPFSLKFLTVGRYFRVELHKNKRSTSANHWLLEKFLLLGFSEDDDRFRRIEVSRHLSCGSHVSCAVLVALLRWGPSDSLGPPPRCRPPVLLPPQGFPWATVSGATGRQTGSLPLLTRSLRRPRTQTAQGDGRGGEDAHGERRRHRGRLTWVTRSDMNQGSTRPEVLSQAKRSSEARRRSFPTFRQGLVSTGHSWEDHDLCFLLRCRVLEDLSVIHLRPRDRGGDALGFGRSVSVLLQRGREFGVWLQTRLVPPSQRRDGSRTHKYETSRAPASGQSIILWVIIVYVLLIICLLFAIVKSLMYLGFAWH